MDGVRRESRADTGRQLKAPCRPSPATSPTRYAITGFIPRAFAFRPPCPPPPGPLPPSQVGLQLQFALPSPNWEEGTPDCIRGFLPGSSEVCERDWLGCHPSFQPQLEQPDARKTQMRGLITGKCGLGRNYDLNCSMGGGGKGVNNIGWAGQNMISHVAFTKQGSALSATRRAASNPSPHLPSNLIKKPPLIICAK